MSIHLINDKQMTPQQAHRPGLCASLIETREHDPFAFLGPRREGEGWLVRVYAPEADRVWLISGGHGESARRAHPADVFEWRGGEDPGSTPLRRGASPSSRIESGYCSAVQQLVALLKDLH